MKWRLLVVAASLIALAGGLWAAEGEKITRDFLPLSFKRPGMHEVSIQPTVTWTGPQTADTAAATLLILERGLAGPTADREIHLTLRPDQLKQLHARLGDMLQVIEGQEPAAPAAASP